MFVCRGGISFGHAEFERTTRDSNECNKAFGYLSVAFRRELSARDIHVRVHHVKTAFKAMTYMRSTAEDRQKVKGWKACVLGHSTIINAIREEKEE